jgi:hypothetical protein
MPERGFQTETWSDRWIESLDPLQRYLFFYLWTNEHCNQAGLYEITLRNIAHETKLPESELPSMIESLAPKVKWYRELDLIWVKNFVRRQVKSPKFLIAAAKCLNLVISRDHSEIIQEFLEYNKSHMVSIPYLYANDTISILARGRSSASASASASADASADAVKKDKVVKEKEEITLPTGDAIPRSRMEKEETLYEGDQEIISVWSSVKGFDLNPADASALVASLRKEFTGVDILAESKAWKARKLSEPLTTKSRASQQIWNWMQMARKIHLAGGVYDQGSKDAGQRGKERVAGSRPREDFKTPWYPPK